MPSEVLAEIDVSRAARQVTWWGLVVNALLAFAKFVWGITASSQALVADAVHSLSDLFTDAMVLVGTGVWSAPADSRHPHGHGRIETLITGLIGLALASVGIGLAYRAISALHAGQTVVPTWPAFVVACVSIVAKEWLYRWTAAIGRRIRSAAIIANAWHHRTDALSSLPVALAVAGSQLNPQWGHLDHVATVIVAALILYAAWTVAVPAFHELTDRGMTEEQVENLVQLVLRTKGVQAMHKLRTRYVGPGVHVDLHILVDPEITVREGHDIATAVRDRLIAEVQEVVEVLVHVEPFEADQVEAGTRLL